MAEFDDLISQYTKTDDNKKSSKSSAALPKGEYSDIISQYTKTKDEPQKAGAAPTGYNSATGTTSYEKPDKITTGSHTPSLPSVTEAVANRVKEGVDTIGSGVSDIMQNKPASGVGKIGLGALSVPAALVQGPADVIDQATGSDIGSRASLIIPVGSGGKATSAVRNALPTNKALNEITAAIGPENAGRVAEAMRADPRLTPADLSPSVKQSTQQLYVLEGDKAKQHISDAVAQRQAGAQQAAQDALDTNLGAAVDPFAKVQELKRNIKAVGAKEIQPAVANAKPVDITPAIQYIDNALKPGVNAIIENPENLLPYDKVQKTLEKFRENLTNDTVNAVDAQQLHKLQSGIRRTADTLIRSTDGESRAMGYALYGLRNKIVDAIDAASPQVNGAGTYKPALAKFRDENHIQDAFEHGHDAVLKNGMNIESRPEFFKDWFSKASDTEKEAAKQGARVAIDTAINGYRSPVTNPNSRAIQMAQVDFNRQRIETLFGKDEADRLFKKLDNERMIADTNNKLVEGSQTAMRAAANSRVALPTKTDIGSQLLPPAIAEAAGSFSGAPGLASGVYAAAKIGAFAKDKIGTALAKERNNQFAQYALPTEAPKREELIRHLEAVSAAHNTPRLSVMNRARLAIRP